MEYQPAIKKNTLNNQIKAKEKSHYSVLNKKAWFKKKKKQRNIYTHLYTLPTGDIGTIVSKT